MKKITALSTLLMVVTMSLMVSILFGGAIAIAFEKPAILLPVATVLFVAAFLVSSKRNAMNVSFTLGICEKVQSSLIEIMGTRAPSLMRTAVGYLQALTSPQNMAGMTVIPIDPGTGKIKEVRIKFIKRATSDIVVDEKPAGCTSELEPEPYEDTIRITQYIGSKGIKFSEPNMRLLCESDAEYMAAQLSAHIDPVVVELNKRLIQEQATNFGYFPGTGSAAVQEVQLLDGDNNNAVVPDGEADILETVEDMDLSDRPMLIGSKKLSKYVRGVGIGCCNDLGQNIGEVGSFDFFRDRFVGGILGNPDDFILLMPGHFQLLTFNEYVGTYRKENDVFSHGTFVDPVSGLTFDSKWHYNDCDDFYTVQFGLWYELFVMPAEAFAYGDDLAGVNFSLHYRALNEAVA